MQGVAIIAIIHDRIIYVKSIIAIDHNIIDMYKCLSGNVRYKRIHTHATTHSSSTHTYQSGRGGAEVMREEHEHEKSAMYVRSHAPGYMSEVNIARRCLFMYV